MHPTIRLTLASLLALSVWGCGSEKPIQYYTVQVPGAPPLTSSSRSVSLVVGRITGGTMFQDTPIAYRSGPNEIGTYQYSRWAQAPVDLVKASLIRVLRASGDYQSVTQLGSTAGGQFLIRGTLYDFEEVDSGEAITGLVSMEFDLIDRSTGKVVWTHYYSHSEPVQAKEIASVVAALDSNLNRGLSEVAAGINQYVTANPPGKA